MTSILQARCSCGIARHLQRVGKRQPTKAAKHVEQKLAPADENSFAPHVEQAMALDPLNLPAGQIAHRPEVTLRP